MGIRAFIFSGYPHLDECRPFRHNGLAAAENLLAAACLWPRAAQHPGHTTWHWRTPLMDRDQP